MSAEILFNLLGTSVHPTPQRDSLLKAFGQYKAVCDKMAKISAHVYEIEKILKKCETFKLEVLKESGTYFLSGIEVTPYDALEEVEDDIDAVFNSPHVLYTLYQISKKEDNSLFNTDNLNSYKSKLISPEEIEIFNAVEHFEKRQLEVSLQETKKSKSLKI